jgi:hypothetical protein
MLSSGMERHIIWYKFTDISEEYTNAIFRLNELRGRRCFVYFFLSLLMNFYQTAMCCITENGVSPNMTMFFLLKLFLLHYVFQQILEHLQKDKET